MKITAEPRSDQWNADDFIGGPRTFTIAGVKVGTAEQKYDIELVEGDGRSWRPPLTMLRLLIAAWGDDAAVWTGRRVTLYRDETVRFGSDAVGGIRISHMSHLPGDKKLTAMLTSTRGRRAKHVVEPLSGGPQLISAANVTEFESRIAAAASLDELGAVAADLKAWELGAFKQQLMAAWKDRQATLKSAPADAPAPEPDPEAAVSPEGGEVTEDQLADLARIRQDEKYDDEVSWLSFVGGAVDRKITKVAELTSAEADTVIALFQGDAS